MTYREKIQAMVNLIDRLYNEAERMRDLALQDEKQYWNDHRRIFYDAAIPLRKLDNMLTPESADRCIHESEGVVNRPVTCINCMEKYQLETWICPDCKRRRKVWDCPNCGKEWRDE